LQITHTVAFQLPRAEVQGTSEIETLQRTVEGRRNRGKVPDVPSSSIADLLRAPQVQQEIVVQRSLVTIKAGIVGPRVLALAVDLLRLAKVLYGCHQLPSPVPQLPPKREGQTLVLPTRTSVQPRGVVQSLLSELLGGS